MVSGGAGRGNAVGFLAQRGRCNTRGAGGPEHAITKLGYAHRLR
jgi:hypothetical protein